MTSQTEIKNVFFLNLKIILDYKQEVPLVLRAEFGITETEITHITVFRQNKITKNRG